MWNAVDFAGPTGTSGESEGTSIPVPEIPTRSIPKAKPPTPVPVLHSASYTLRSQKIDQVEESSTLEEEEEEDFTGGAVEYFLKRLGIISNT